MVYAYRCRNHGDVDIYKSSEYSDKEERCEICSIVMVKLITSPNMNPSGAAMRGMYQPAFGKHFDSMRQQKNEIRRIEGETGKKIIEVGTDKRENVKRVRKTFDEGEAVRHLAHKLKHGTTD